jgi:[ribosomal protein S18]-alanine N-acetyltransferase
LTATLNLLSPPKGGGRLLKAVLGRVGEYSIRRCGDDDIAAVIQINLRALPERYSDHFYYEILTEAPETFLVAELGSSVVGYLMCRIEYGFSNLKRLSLARKGHIVSIAVLPEHRGKGVGTKLLELGHAEMVKKSCSECYLEVRVTNEGAIALYQRLAYKVTSRLDGYYKDGEAAYLMATQIGS